MSAVLMRANFDSEERKRNSIEQTLLKPLAKKPRLPLKKRFYEQRVDDDAPDASKVSESSASEPVDFSLPTRSRAKLTPDKEKHSDTDSDKLSETDSRKSSPSAARALDLCQKPPPTPGKSHNSPKSLPPSTPSKNSAFTATFASPGLPRQLLPADLMRLASGFPLPGLLPSSFPALYPGAIRPPAPLPSPSLDLAGPSPSAEPGVFVINPATGNKVRRNYKNMTRERRMEANARERTRVHTIGAAFEQVRRLVPSLAPDQKLSKLSMLRIACKYILLLAAMNGLDYSADKRKYSVEECVEMLNDTIVAESKAKRLER